MDHFKIGNDKFLFEPSFVTPSNLLLSTNFDLLGFSKSVEENDTVLDSLMHLRLEQMHKNCGLTNDTEWKRKHDNIKLEIFKGLLKSFRMEKDAMQEERDNALKERDNALKQLESHRMEVDAMRKERDNANNLVKEITSEKTPQAFICPITHEVMKDPQFAADGYTYEAEAIKKWFADHNTSPMTNLKLSHKKLVSNLLLRSAIQNFSLIS